jgi:hypothetical protein
MMYFQKERGSRWDDVHFDDPICGTLLRRDFLTIFALLLWTLVLNLPGLGSLEFFRHTEADRTLIAWEMLDRRDFLIPHILGSEILTKPPIFYWMVAAAIHLSANQPSGWRACRQQSPERCLVITQFVFLRKAGASYILSTLTALSLSTGILFLNLASSAEIDMVYGFSQPSPYRCSISVSPHRAHYRCSGPTSWQPSPFSPRGHRYLRSLQPPSSCSRSGV